jgi:hypothetical protein
MRRICLLVALCPFMAAAPAAAQGLNLQLVPKIGVYSGIGGLTETTEIKPALAYGLAAEITLPFLSLFNVRANVDVVQDGEIEQRTAEEPRVGAVTMMNIVGDIVIRPLPRAVLAQPYFLAGGGVKQYDMDLETAAGGELSGVEESSSRFTGHIGGGLDVRWGSFALVLEVGDYISSFGDKLQNDLVGMVGFRVSMF